MASTCYQKCMDSRETSISSSEKKCIKNCLKAMQFSHYKMFEILQKKNEEFEQEQENQEKEKQQKQNEDKLQQEKEYKKEWLKI
ncbi:unnamed protein product [Moneuplotes crassus]|uniref:Mitochondrial import inner membrane translocase subunit n=1 Tax=Euplotes crassus TaxID=5936 RepID=A0AAD1Y9G2_EUPCR|nr:unnamed protein product [Moneuplotes crassus]